MTDNDISPPPLEAIWCLGYGYWIGGTLHGQGVQVQIGLALWGHSQMQVGSGSNPVPPPTTPTL